MLDQMELPDGLRLARTTREFGGADVPGGLLRSHRIAEGVWGVLRVVAGDVTFVLESSGESRRLGDGDRQVIEPEVPHHVEPGEGSRFVVEFYR